MKAKLDFGAEIDFLTKGELDESLSPIQALLRAEAEGLRHVRLPALQGVVSATGTLLLGSITTGDLPSVGPRSGYAWSIKRVSVFGLSGTDALQLYWGEPSPLRYVGTFSASSTEWDTGHGLLLKGDDHLTLSGTGLTVGETVTVSGEAIEAPQEQIYKLIGA